MAGHRARGGRSSATRRRGGRAHRYAEGVDRRVRRARASCERRPRRVAEGDAVIFFNFRPDRAREITRAFVDPAFEGFARPVFPKVRFVCLTEYDPTIPAPVAFPKELPMHVLGRRARRGRLRQLHIAETEKYAHVTFFLNGGVEPPKAGEERILVRAPRWRPTTSSPR